MIDTIRTINDAQVERLGRWLIVAGVLVWAVWLTVTLTGGDPQLRYFLPFHLLGVVPGAILSRWASLRRWRKRPR